MMINPTSSLILSRLPPSCNDKFSDRFQRITKTLVVEKPLLLLLSRCCSLSILHSNFSASSPLLHHLHLSLAPLTKWTTHASAKLALRMLRHCALRLRLLSLALLFLLFRPHRFLRPSVPRRQHLNLVHSRRPSKSYLRSCQRSTGLLQRRRKNLAQHPGQLSTALTATEVTAVSG